MGICVYIFEEDGRLYELLRNEYKIENRKFGENIPVAKIYGLIQRVEGVSHFIMNYPDVDEITANIDEVLFLLPANTVSLIDPVAISLYDIDITMRRVLS